MTQYSLEERVAALESKIVAYEAELTHLRAQQEVRADLAALQGNVREVDQAVTHLSERTAGHEQYVQARFGVVDYDLKSIDSDVKALQAGQQEIKESVREGFQEVRGGQQALQASQEQILALLTGQVKTND